MRDTLVGCWVLLSEGNSYRVGQVTLSLGANYHLLRWRPYGNAPQAFELLRSDVLCTDEKEERIVHFFEAESKLDEWLAWLNTPESDKRPRLVQLKPL